MDTQNEPEYTRSNLMSELFRLTRNPNPLPALLEMPTEKLNLMIPYWLGTHSDPDSQIAYGDEYKNFLQQFFQNIEHFQIPEKTKANLVSKLIGMCHELFEERWEQIGITDRQLLVDICKENCEYWYEPSAFIFRLLSDSEQKEVFLYSLSRGDSYQHLVEKKYTPFTDVIRSIPDEEFFEILVKNLEKDLTGCLYSLTLHQSNSEMTRKALAQGLPHNEIRGRTTLLLDKEHTKRSVIEEIVGEKIFADRNTSFLHQSIPSNEALAFILSNLATRENEGEYFRHGTEDFSRKFFHNYDPSNEIYNSKTIPNIFSYLAWSLSHDEEGASRFSSYSSLSVLKPVFFSHIDDVDLINFIAFHPEQLREEDSLPIHRRNDVTSSAMLNHLDLFKGWIQDVPSPWARERLEKTSLHARFGLLAVAALSPLQLLEDVDLASNYVNESYSTAIKSLIRKGQKESLLPQWFNAVTAESQDQRVVMALLRAAMTYHSVGIEPPADIQAKGPKQCARWLLGKMVGAPINQLFDHQELSSNSAREFYLAFLDLNESFRGYPLEKVVSFTPQSFEKQNRPETLKFLHNLITITKLNPTFLSGASLFRDSTTFEHRFIPTHLEPTAISTLIEQQKDFLLKRFYEVFQLDPSQATEQQVAQLETRWGSFDPFFILQGALAPYLTERDYYSSEASPLTQVINTSLQSNEAFLRFRYQDDLPSEERQIGFLPKKQEKIWRENFSSLKVFSPLEAESIPESNHGEYLQQLFTTNILPHIQHVRTLDIPTSKKRENLFAEIIKAFNEDQRDTILDIAKHIATESSRYDLHLPECAQVRNDLKECISILDGRPKKKSDDMIFFTTLTDDPNLMIQIGRVVQASSCQDYINGTVRQTLPGYIIDGNIKGALGFIIEKSDFFKNGYNSKDYQVLVDALKENSDQVSYDFNHALKIITFSVGEKKFSIHKENAMRRNILRLGANENEKADFLVERAYMQNFSFESALARFQDEFIEQFRTRLNGGISSNSLSFPASENPFGVYSDAANGIETDEWTITLARNGRSQRLSLSS